MAQSQTQHSQSANRRRVLLGKIEPIMCVGLTYLINQEPDLWVCGNADDTEEIIEAATNWDPELVLIRLSLPGSRGLELIQTLHCQTPRVKILVLSSYDERLYAMRSLRAGAQGYLSKSLTPSALIEAIHQILNGEIVVSESFTSQFIQSMVQGETAQTPSWGGELTDREIEVLHFIGQGLSIREIADHLHLHVHTVRAYRYRLMKKLDLEDFDSLLRYAVHWAANQEAGQLLTSWT